MEGFIDYFSNLLGFSPDAPVDQSRGEEGVVAQATQESSRFATRMFETIVYQIRDINIMPPWTPWPSLPPLERFQAGEILQTVQSWFPSWFFNIGSDDWTTPTADTWPESPVDYDWWPADFWSLRPDNYVCDPTAFGMWPVDDPIPRLPTLAFEASTPAPAEASSSTSACKLTSDMYAVVAIVVAVATAVAVASGTRRAST